MIAPIGVDIDDTTMKTNDQGKLVAKTRVGISDVFPDYPENGQLHFKGFTGEFFIYNGEWVKIGQA